jgi:hypothetical protein
MLLVMIFELTTKYILLLFLLVATSNYALFVMFQRLYKPKRKTHEKVASYVFHLLYGFCILCGFHPVLGSTCSNEQIYRKAFKSKE